ncbi:MAG TPA: hypothetical protein VIH90_08450 [Candidatus Saccharimonadales bacterium]
MSIATVESGHNQHDPIRDFLSEAPSDNIWHQSTITERSSSLFIEALNLAQRLPSSSSVVEADGVPSLVVVSDEIAYKTPANGEGYIWLETTFPTSPIGSLAVGEGTEVVLMAGALSVPDKWILALTRDGIFRNSFGSRTPADHADINFFDRIILHRVKGGVFPKKKP